MNKKIVGFFLSVLTTATASAQLQDGFYRIQNDATKRYVSMQDNTGHIYAAQTDIDAAALRTKSDFDKILSDAGSVIYLHAVGNNQYDISAQGTSLYKMIGHYIKLTKQSSGCYYAWQESSGVRLYLSDIDDGEPDAYVYAGDKTTRAWNFLPVSSTSSNYMGLNPTVEHEGNFYASFYSGFAFTPQSEGLNVYYVSKVDAQKGMVVYKQVNGLVPANSPVFVDCPSRSHAENLIEFTTATASALPSNQLRGVYFNLDDKFYTGHYNRTAYDEKTMRVLGICSDGSLGYVTSTTLDFIPANTSYLKVPESAPAELKLVTEKEYATSVGSLSAEDGLDAPVFDLSGVKVGDGAGEVQSLHRGVYIRDGKKFMKY